MTRAASANFADASRNMEPEPLPPGWVYRWSGGHYAIVRDPNFIGEPAPPPPGAIER